MLDSKQQIELADLIEKIYKLITTKHGTDSHIDGTIKLGALFDELQPLASELKTYATKIKSSQP